MAQAVTILDEDKAMHSESPRPVKRPIQARAALFKIRAIERLHAGESRAAVRRDIQVAESTLRGWIKQEPKIRMLARNSSTSDNEADSPASSSGAKRLREGDGTSTLTCDEADSPARKRVKLDSSTSTSAIENGEDDLQFSSSASAADYTHLLSYVRPEIYPYLTPQFFANANLSINLLASSDSGISPAYLDSTVCPAERLNTSSAALEDSWIWQRYQLMMLKYRRIETPEATTAQSIEQRSPTKVNEVLSDTLHQNDSNDFELPEGTTVCTLPEAICHGSELLKWLNQATDPQIDLVQIMQLESMLNRMELAMRRKQEK